MTASFSGSADWKSKQSPTVQSLRRLAHRPAALAALAVLVLLALLAAAAPIVAPYDPLAMGTGMGLAGPEREHIFGTDLFGRDILSRVIHGARISLGVAFASVLLAAVVGVTLGLLAGYYGGWLEMAVMRVMDILLAFPGIFLALSIVSLLGPSLVNAVLAVGISAIPTYTRTVRGCVLSARENLYVTAAHVAGCDSARIMLRHILPNVFAPVIILMTLGVAWAILNICALSFLGLGAQAPTPEWGLMLHEGRSYLRQAWWVTTFPGLAIMVTVMAVNRLGDGLRDALDPRLKV
jgi:peptide/nickel transport system permease protein